MKPVDSGVPRVPAQAAVALIAIQVARNRMAVSEKNTAEWRPGVSDRFPFDLIVKIDVFYKDIGIIGVILGITPVLIDRIPDLLESFYILDAVCPD